MSKDILSVTIKGTVTDDNGTTVVDNASEGRFVICGVFPDDNGIQLSVLGSTNTNMMVHFLMSHRKAMGEKFDRALALYEVLEQIKELGGTVEQEGTGGA